MSATSDRDRPALPRRRRVYLVRHGDVDYFDASGVPLRPDTVELNERGRRQVEALRRELEGLPIDRVVTSGLPRAVQTASILVDGRGLEIESREALVEVRPGRLADLLGTDIEKAFLGAFTSCIDRSSRFLGGESFGDFHDRVLPAFAGLVAERDWSAILVVAHGGVNRAILLSVLGAGLAGFGAIEQDAGALNVIDVGDDGRAIVRLLNHTAYAPAKAGLVHTTMEEIYARYRGWTLGS